MKFGDKFEISITGLIILAFILLAIVQVIWGQ